MRRVAQQIGIRAPRIYKHLPHKETLQAAISTPTPRRCTARRLAMVIASRFLPPASATADRHSPGFPDARDRDAKFAIACSPSTPPPFLERNSHDAPSTLPSRAAPPAQREPLRRPAPRTRTDTNAGLGTVDDVRPANRQSRDAPRHRWSGTVGDQRGVLLWHELGYDDAAARALADLVTRVDQHAVRRCRSPRPSSRPIEPFGSFPRRRTRDSAGPDCRIPAIREHARWTQR